MKRPKEGPPGAAVPDPEERSTRVDGAGETRVAVASLAGEGLLECPLCLLDQPSSACPALPSCGHRSCRDCLERYLRLAISESRVPVACPQCPAPLHLVDLPGLLSPEAAAALCDKYDEYLLRRLLVADPGTRWCPAPDCSYAVLAYSCAECPRLVCGRQGCGTEFCYHCRQLWHPGSSCKQAWQEWKQEGPSGAMEIPTHLIQEEEPPQDPGTIKVCPRCGAFIMKINDGSCNRMSCTACGCLFCWLCLREITDVHFLSPSGCTFWGEKPWSRTRKLTWQLGMVLGAPMVISLVASIAVPVLTLGIPIYMGKKVLRHGRKSQLSSCCQGLSVAGILLLSLVISPVITAVTVGVGVPLMLTYVYGVVALSLCRSRWGCWSPQRNLGELNAVQLENLAKLNELLAVPPIPTEDEAWVGASPSAPPLTDGSNSQQKRAPQVGSTAAVARSTLGEAPEAPYMEGLRMVKVEGPGAFKHSLGSAASSLHSSSADAQASTSNAGSLAGVMTE